MAKEKEHSREVEVNDNDLLRLVREKTAIQVKGSQSLKSVDKEIRQISRINKKIRDLNLKIKEQVDKKEPLEKKIQPVMDGLDQLKVEDGKVKEKIVPLVEKLIENELGEYEMYETTTLRDGKVYVKVVDRLEEWKDNWNKKK